MRNVDLSNFPRKNNKYIDWKNTIGIMELSRIFKLDKTTVRKYLNYGSEIGWCTYSVNESIVNREINKVLAVKRKSDELTNLIHKCYEKNKLISSKEVAKILNIDRCTVRRHLKKIDGLISDTQIKYYIIN